MLSTLSGFGSLQRLAPLLPGYFLARAFLLLGFGCGCIGVLLLHLTALPDSAAAVLILTGCAATLLLANAYMILWFPLRESDHFPQQPTHPMLMILVLLQLVLTWSLLQEGRRIGADLHLLAFAQILPACSVAGLRWTQSSLLLSVSSLAAAQVLLPATGTPFTLLVLFSQFFTLVLFKSMVEEFRNRSILDTHLAELKATQHLLQQSVAQSTRQSIARDLHDELGHLVTRLHHSLQHCQPGAVSNPAWQQAQLILRELRQQVRSVALQLREPATFQLHDTLQLLAQSIPRPHIDLQLKGLPLTCPAPQGEVLFRICQEAITNSLRHSNATRLTITLTLAQGRYQLWIQDNGTPSTAQAQHHFTPGTGLTGLQERAQLLGGELSCRMTAQGFCITATLPECGDA